MATRLERVMKRLGIKKTYVRAGKRRYKTARQLLAELAKKTKGRRAAFGTFPELQTTYNVNGKQVPGYDIIHDYQYGWIRGCTGSK